MKLKALLCCLVLPLHCTELPVMSFNIRFGDSPDGLNSWPERANLVAETIWNYGPALVGLQESLHFQVEKIVSFLPNYRFHQSHWNSILYDTRTVELLDARSHWMPSLVAGQQQRLLTWGVFRHRPTNQTIHHFNTHLDPSWIDGRTRLAHATSIKAKVASVVPQGSVAILTGDFNCARGSAPWRALVDGEEGTWDDAWVAAETRKADTLFTYHHFMGTKVEQFPLRTALRLVMASSAMGPLWGWPGFVPLPLYRPELQATVDPLRGQPVSLLLDWILSRNLAAPRRFEVVQYHGENGRWPSDHFPVIAQFDLP
eukprot:TRINITY_DN3061_c0_g1_i1.p1 TRINITY_DN3061_c0_g1~~TRINITY_DN3061_c0_g1_i1.p1  ORF type:complete len:314 (+),score=26.07 TRINITY_DN3061_c0_g1_i1:22-963(+)